MQVKEIFIWFKLISSYRFGRFSGMVTRFSLHISAYDHFEIHKQSNSSIILLIVYVDDIVIIGSDNVDIQTLKTILTKDLGNLVFYKIQGLSK